MNEMINFQRAQEEEQEEDTEEEEDTLFVALVSRRPAFDNSGLSLPRLTTYRTNHSTSYFGTDGFLHTDAHARKVNRSQ